MDERKIQWSQLIGQFLGIVLFTSLVGYIVINNLSPFGVTSEYSLTNSKNTISPLGPKNRVSVQNIGGQKLFVQTHDLIYFTTPMPFQFDTATVRLTYLNPDPDQTLSLGFQDQEGWHYDTQLFDVPFLNSLTWNRIGTNPVLYQREKNFSSAGNFLINPPIAALIGTYSYDTDLGKSTASVQLPNYSPSSQDTVINTPLRGHHVLYAYLQNEPFRMTIQKQDLNWYEDPDPMNISVYKDNILVFSTQIDDDGITDASKKIMPPQEITIKNPGPGLPENGVYKIILDTSSDSVITKITTNLHKLVFQGSIFLANNAQVYPGIAASTSATTLFTNALNLSATTLHSSGVQDIAVGDNVLRIASTSGQVTIIPKNTITKIVIPKNDVTLKGFQGFFAFSPDQFFIPIPYNVLPITQKEDVSLVDYILTSYTPSRQIGDLRYAEHTFTLSSAYIANGQLSWIIEAPGLQDNNRQIFIKDVSVIFHKKPWL